MLFRIINHLIISTHYMALSVLSTIHHSNLLANNTITTIPDGSLSLNLYDGSYTSGAYSTFTYYKITSGGTLYLNGTGTLNYYIVGGGGQGGAGCYNGGGAVDCGGNGGNGGVIKTGSIQITGLNNTNIITIGAGGTSVQATNYSGVQGGTTSIGSLVSGAGGLGGRGGSRGAATAQTSVTDSAIGGKGSQTNTFTNGANGTISCLPLSNVKYGGGGGGSGRASTTFGYGGITGGGIGGSSVVVIGQYGTANTGGGGGGGSGSGGSTGGVGGYGGSGLVVIWF